MITINGKIFNEIPYMCGVCTFYTSGKEDKWGFCTMFKKQKRRYDNIPARCLKLFQKGFAIGGDLVIVQK